MCSNRKGNYSKTSITIDKKKENAEGEIIEQINDSENHFLNLSPHRDLPKSLSSSPQLHCPSKISSPEIVISEEDDLPDVRFNLDERSQTLLLYTASNRLQSPNILETNVSI